VFIILRFLCLLLTTTPLCDWHHFGSHGGSYDPETQAIMDASAVAVVVAFVSSLLMFVAGGPLILVFTRRVRHLFWAIPAVNVAVYTVTIIARPYPGGFCSRFHMPGLPSTILELIFLTVLSLGAAIVLAAIYLVYRVIHMAVTALRRSSQPKNTVLSDRPEDG
jgi:hypothetical protein